VATITWKIFTQRRLVIPASDLEKHLLALRQSSDIDGLIELLREAAPPEKVRVAALLKELTGRDFGIRARHWRRWRHSVEAGGWHPARSGSVTVLNLFKWLCVSVVVGSLMQLPKWKWWRRSQPRA
jgi:hypothetical protein